MNAMAGTADTIAPVGEAPAKGSIKGLPPGVLASALTIGFTIRGMAQGGGAAPSSLGETVETGLNNVSNASTVVSEASSLVQKATPATAWVAENAPMLAGAGQKMAAAATWAAEKAPIVAGAIAVTQMANGNVEGAAATTGGFLAGMAAGAVGGAIGGPVGAALGAVGGGILGTEGGQRIYHALAVGDPVAGRADMAAFDQSCRESVDSPQGQHVMALLKQDPSQLTPEQNELRGKLATAQKGLENASPDRPADGGFSPLEKATMRLHAEEANAVRTVSRREVLEQDAANQKLIDSPAAERTAAMMSADPKTLSPEQQALRTRLERSENDMIHADPIAPAGADFSPRQMATFRYNGALAEAVHQVNGDAPAQRQGPSLDAGTLGANPLEHAARLASNDPETQALLVRAKAQVSEHGPVSVGEHAAPSNVREAGARSASHGR